jgi:hypothetical protein
MESWMALEWYLTPRLSAHSPASCRAVGGVVSEQSPFKPSERFGVYALFATNGSLSLFSNRMASCAHLIFLHIPMSSNPDTGTFPHATGIALQTVKAHEKDEDLVLWGSWWVHSETPLVYETDKCPQVLPLRTKSLDRT